MEPLFLDIKWESAEVHVNDNYSYFVQIKRIVNTVDDGTDELRKF